MTVPDRVSLPSAGYEVVDAGLPPEQIDAIRAAVTPVLAQHSERGGVRNVVARVPSLLPVVSGPLQALARPYLGADAIPVRILLFDKTPLANWKVTWHQNVTIAVTEYRETLGWGPWSRKDGLWHVRPPAAVLAGMLTVRLHLDPCGPRNGPVRVIPGSHQLGRLSDAEVDAAVRSAISVDCVVPAGGALIMRPLILHSSAPAAEPTHRRVLHAEFAAAPLPDGFEWADPCNGLPAPMLHNKHLQQTRALILRLRRKRPRC